MSLSRPASAAIVNYDWYRVFGAGGAENGYVVAVDSNGDIYSSGNFNSYGSSVDFDGTAGTDNHSADSEDVYLTKYNADGTYGWTRTFGSAGSGNDDSATDIVIDGSYIYLIGYFEGSNVDFDGTAGTDLHSSNGSKDIFITRYDTSGNYSWTRTFGGTSDDRSGGIDVDSGYIYAAGYFQGTDVDFDGTAGTDLHSSNGGYDFFITRYDTSGNYSWTVTVGGTGQERGNAIDVDSGYVYCGGAFSGTVDFDPTGGTENHTAVHSLDAFVTRYSTAGGYSWTRSVGGNYMDSVSGIEADGSGGVYLSGVFNTTVDFDPTAGTDTHSTNNQSSDVFISMYGTDGSYDWTRTFGGSDSEFGTGFMLDVNGNIVVKGETYSSSVDFDGTSGTDTYTSNGYTSSFTTMYYPNGDYGWTLFSTGTGSSIFGGGSASNANTMVYNGVFYEGEPDLDGTSGTDYYTEDPYGYYIYLSKYSYDFQITNLDSGFDAQDGSGNSLEVGSSYGAGDDEDVYIVDTSTGRILSDVTVNLSLDSDWSGVSGEVDENAGKVVVDGLTTAPGAASTHALYSPIPAGTDAACMVVCPDATAIGDVSASCTNGETICAGETETVTGSGWSGDVTVSKVSVNGRNYLKADGVGGTGGQTLFNDFALRDTLTRLEVSQDSDHTIEFGSINGLTSSSDYIEVEFDPTGQAWDLSGITVSDIDLEDDGTDKTLAASAGADIWGVSINTSTDTITFTAPTSGTDYIAASSVLTVKVGTVADGGSNQITNPSSVGEYEVHMRNYYNSGADVESGEVEIPIIDDDTVNITGYIDTQLSFDIDTATTDLDCDAAGGTSPCDSHGGVTDDAGYVVDLGEMLLDPTSAGLRNSGDSGVMHADGITGTVNYIWLDLETNAVSGAVVTVESGNGSLYRDASNEIPSVTNTGSGVAITGASGLYGIREESNTSFTVAGDYNGVAGTYGELSDTSPIQILSVSGPVTAARAQLDVGAAPDSDDGTGTYTDTITLIATCTF